MRVQRSGGDNDRIIIDMRRSLPDRLVAHVARGGATKKDCRRRLLYVDVVYVSPNHIPYC